MKIDNKIHLRQNIYLKRKHHLLKHNYYQNIKITIFFFFNFLDYKLLRTIYIKITKEVKLIGKQ